MSIKPPIKPGETYRLTVKGAPVGQGAVSSVAVMRNGPDGRKVPVLGKNGYPITNTKHTNEQVLKPWRQEIAGVAAQDWGALGLGALDDPFAVTLRFYVKRPQAHYGTGRNAEVLKDSAALYPATRSAADLDHLERAVLDALTDIIWRNDKQVVSMNSRVLFGVPERVEIAVRRFRVLTVGDLRGLRGLEPDLAESLAQQLQLTLPEAVAA